MGHAGLPGSRTDRRAWVILLVTVAILSAVGRGEDAAPSQMPTSPTFGKDIAPIIFANCATCHRPGESAPFDLLSYSDVSRRANQIVEVTRSRYMPPWLPEHGFAEFVGQRRLSAAQIKLIEKWAVEGAVQGDPADLPPTPQWIEGWQLGRPDLVIELPQPYTLAAEGTDVFRNFVIPIPVKTGRYVKAVELRPGNSKIVHHAVMRTDRTGSTRYLDERDPGPGFGGMSMGKSEMPDGHFLGWTPGKMPHLGTDDMSWRLEPGTDLVLQLHMLPRGKPEQIQPKIGFFFAQRPPTRMPIEVRLGPRSIDIPAGENNYVLEDDYTLPVDVDVLGVYPHAHYLAREMRGFARLPDGSIRWLIRIKDWDFNWQDDYRFVEPIHLPAGTRIMMRYRYDNSADNVRNPNRPPRRVTYGWRSFDEMADLSLQVVPRRGEGRAVLENELRTKGLRADIAGFQTMLRVDPANAQVQGMLGSAYIGMGRIQDAVAPLREAIRLEPNHARAHNNLGIALQNLGQFDQAMRHYHLALQAWPDFAQAHNNLALGLHQQKNTESAIEHLRRAVRIKPNYAEAHYNLAFMLAAAGQLDDVPVHFREALRLKSGWSAPALNNIAWIQATHPDAALRDPRQAIALATRACQLTGRQHPGFLDTLAAAYAAAGQFEKAIATAGAAIELASAAGQARLARQIRTRQRLYEQGRPFRAGS